MRDGLTPDAPLSGTRTYWPGDALRPPVDTEGQLTGERAYKGVPPEQRVFDDNMLSAARLLATAGNWAVQVQEDERGTVLVCRACTGMIEPVITTQGRSYPLQLTQTLSNTLRHMVNGHDFALSGRGNDGG